MLHFSMTYCPTHLFDPLNWLQHTIGDFNDANRFSRHRQISSRVFIG